jgi:UDP-glucose 4-epimerase
MSNRVLVTGGAGFVGSHLVDSLIDRHYEVIVLDNLLRGNKLNKNSLNKCKFINSDVRNSTKVDETIKGCNYVFHLAAFLGVDEVAKNPKETMEIESLGTYNIVNSSIKHGIEKIIYISTSGVYGKSEFNKAVSEDFSVSPTSSYAIAKRFNEIYLQSVFKKYNLNTFSLRYFNVYGPRQDNRMVISRFLNQAMKNKIITVYGDGMQTRDFTFIDDTVKATIDIAEKCKGTEIINIARGEDITILDIAKEIIKLTNSNSQIKLVKSPKYRQDFDVEKRCGSSSKLNSLINYKPDTDLINGLKKTYNYFLNLK